MYPRMHAGMFMVNLTMMSKEGETILTSLRPVSWVGVVGH